MAVENQTDEMFAGNRHVLRWNGITDSGGTTLIDLTGRIVKFSLARFSSSGDPITGSPTLDMRSDVSAQVTIPNPILGSSHVEVVLLPVDTLTLATKSTDYYIELEVFESDESSPIVVTTGTITIKPNVENA